MRPSFLKLFGSILGFVLVGTPLVAYLWETLNQLMAGHFNGPRVAIGAVAALVLAALLRFLARSVWRWEGTREVMPEASGRNP
jgi:asparagine N-glycosylation enzyme membrane subunit Stt3